MSLEKFKEYFLTPKTIYSINLDYYPNNTQWILTEVEKYCIKDNLSFEIVESKEEPIVKINNILCNCIVSTGGRGSDYVITCKEI